MQRRLRMILLRVFDAFLINLGFLIAFYLRFYEQGIPDEYIGAFIKIFVLATFIYLVSFHLFRLYHRVWSYASTGELLSVLYAVTAGAFGTIAASYFIRSLLPRSVIILAWAFIILLVGGSRFAWRLYMDRKKGGRHLAGGRNALIVGAGDAGVVVAKELLNNPQLAMLPVAFIDDDPSKKNMSVMGIPVVGGRVSIPEVVTEKDIKDIIIAMPSVSGLIIREIVNICRSTQAVIKILPGVFEIINGKVSIERLRKVQLEDLLYREPVKVDLTSISKYLDGKVVLVTGAGGSIGSELCRQVAHFNPHKLIILGHGENSINRIWYELRDLYPGLDVVVEIADVRDFQRVAHIFEIHHPDVVYHAAAHKHVPLMEMHPSEAVKTNILGTRNLADAANKTGVKVFVMISSDKAVNPSSVMGATKLIAELMIRQLNRQSNTVFTAVRFGNVLGSNSSVVPIFRQQIINGGPVTVTHPEMTRYFMIIPEAVSLAIQAGSFAKGGEVFVLDMGEPVKILDLARDMIKLSGYEPDKDISIIFTGIRPGEKLYEELMTEEEDATSTIHKKIFVARPLNIDTAQFDQEFAKLTSDPDQLDSDALFGVLKRTLPGFVDSRQK